MLIVPSYSAITFINADLAATRHPLTFPVKSAVHLTVVLAALLFLRQTNKQKLKQSSWHMISFVITMLCTHALKHFLCLRPTVTKMSKSKVFCFTFASKSKGTFQLLNIFWYASSFMRGTVHGPLSCLWWCKANIMATSMFLRNEAHYLSTKILNKLVHSVYCCIWKSQERQKKNGRESNNCVNTHTCVMATLSDNTKECLLVMIGCSDVLLRPMSSDAFSQSMISDAWKPMSLSQVVL